jgi:hypothetical protein
VPTQKQQTVDLLDEKRLITKSRDDVSLSVSFPDSPIIGKHITITDKERHDYFQDHVLDITEGGWCFDSFNRNYDENGAPSLENPPPGFGVPDVLTGPEGLPGSPHMPNPVSPGEGGGVDPANMGDPPAELESLPQHASMPPFVGVGSGLSPKTSSKRMAGMRLGDYIMGKSSDQTIGSDSRGLIIPPAPTK